MRRKVIAAVLILANLITLSSCAGSDTPSRTTKRDDDDDDTPSHAQEAIMEAADDISETLAKCDYEAFSDLCLGVPDEMEEAMPVIYDDPNDDYDKPDKHLVVKNMIAATISYEIDEDSFESSFLGNTCSIDVKYSYKDYKKAKEMRDLFVNPGDFNSMLAEVTETVSQEVTLEFKKSQGEYLLTNPDDLIGLYAYDVDDIEFMRSLFDMVEDMYMTGDGWDPATESYTDTNTFEIVLVLSDQAQEYIWQYVYRVVEETAPKWRNIYQSETITDRYPTEIHITYTQDEIFTEGFYAILFYNYYDDTIIGMEFDVFVSKPDTAETSENSETSETT